MPVALSNPINNLTLMLYGQELPVGGGGDGWTWGLEGCV